MMKTLPDDRYGQSKSFIRVLGPALLVTGSATSAGMLNFIIHEPHKEKPSTKNHQHPDTTRLLDAGYFTNISPALIGQSTNPPPQLGHFPASFPSTHDRQNVHSKLQIIASLDSGGRSQSQHAQFGRSSSIRGALLPPA